MEKLAGKKILLVGAHGMLASDCIPLLKDEGAKLKIVDIKDEVPEGFRELEYSRVDLCDKSSLDSAIASFEPDWIVNCAAFTAVDLAESEREVAFKVNETGVENLALAAKECGARVCHISTDYVFGGNEQHRERTRPFTEEDIEAPCGVYGRSKFGGEKRLRKLLPEAHLILRTSWLFGKGGPNFVATMIRLGKELDEIKVVDDQTGSPTWTGWLSEVILDLIAIEARGTFHASSSGNITWNDFATEIFSKTGLDIKVSKQSTEEMARPAKRPVFSTMSTSKLEGALGRKCPDWRSTLEDYLKKEGYNG